MFLTSDALRGLDERQLNQWNWSATSILWISYDWDPARGGGAEALAGRRLVAALLEARARVHVLTTNGADEGLRCAHYDATVVSNARLSGNKLGRALQMIRCGIPEGPGLWVSRAVSAGVRVLSSLPADTIIYGRAMPGSSNVVAWHLARLTGRAWVAHFSDDWPPLQVLSNGRKWLAPYKPPLFRFWRRRIVRGRRSTDVHQSHGLASELLGGDRRSLAKSFVVAHLGSDAAPGPVPVPVRLVRHRAHGQFLSARPHIRRGHAGPAVVSRPESVGKTAMPVHPGGLGEWRHARLDGPMRSRRHRSIRGTAASSRT